MRVAILDDYQQVSLASTDWSAVRSLGQIDVFAEHIARTEALVSALEPYDVIVAMRERTLFDADRLGQLPRLRLLVTTGMGNPSIDLAAAAARGVTVCGTGGIGSSTAELTWGLILALTRHIPEEDQRMKMAGRAGGAALGFGRLAADRRRPAWTASGSASSASATRASGWRISAGRSA